MIGRINARIEGREMKIDMTDYTIEGQQIDTLCNVTIKQKFVNNTGNTVECSYVFPNDNKFCIYDTEFVFNGKVIRPELRAKEEAKKEYEEAVKQGHSAMFGHDLGNGTCEFKLGNLENNKDAEIHVKASFLCTVTEKDINFKFPLTARFQEGAVTSSIPDKTNFNLEMQIHQNSSDIKEVNCSVKNEVTKIDSKTYKLSIKEIPKADAIFINTILEEGSKSIAVASDGYVCISAYPSFEAKVETNSEYVFIVDCSGSMSGSRIDNAAKCMKIFLHSLPEDCMFAIWKFGSSSQCMIPSSKYTKENIEKASEMLNDLKANLGGTNLMDPLEKVISSEIPNGFTRQMFILTDGEIRNTKDVLGFVRSKRGQNRIFSVGLGSGADSGLINGLAEIANGLGIQVNDNDESLTEKVIGMLEAALQPAMSNVSLISDGMTEQWPSPAPAVYNHSHQNFIIKSPYQECVLISGTVADESIDEAINVYKAPDGIGLKELFMSKAIEDLQYDIRVNNDESKKAKVIEYSLASHVLSEYTAYVGIDFESSVERDRMIVGGGMRCKCACKVHAKAFPKCFGIAGPRPMMMMECCAEPNSISMRSAPPQLMACRAMAAPPQFEETCERKQEEKPRDPIEEIVDLQNPDGSWESSKNINEELVNKFNKKVAATIASIAFLRKNAGSKLNSLKLIIKKALNFLHKFNNSVDWEALIHEEESKL